jgi:hypothetical protein
MKVSNMTSGKGSKVPNQFIISGDDGGNTFQSYSSIIAHISPCGAVTLDRNKWDYSVTTGKYRNQFLGETAEETKRKIKSGEYKLADLNR